MPSESAGGFLSLLGDARPRVCAQKGNITLDGCMIYDMRSELTSRYGARRGMPGAPAQHSISDQRVKTVEAVSRNNGRHS